MTTVSRRWALQIEACRAGERAEFVADFGLVEAGGLASIVAAAVSGAAFVNSGQAGSSMAMAILTGVALLCYLANLLVTTALRLSLGRSAGSAP